MQVFYVLNCYGTVGIQYHAIELLSKSARAVNESHHSKREGLLVLLHHYKKQRQGLKYPCFVYIFNYCLVLN